MDNKDIEKKLQEGADNIEVRDFSLVWQDIKPKIVPARKKHFRWVPVAASVASIVVACSIIIPVALNQNSGPTVNENQNSGSSDQFYFSDELLLAEVTPEALMNKLNLAGLDTVDFNRYVISSSYLFKTVEQSVKGGKVELTDDLDFATFYLAVDFYDESVRIDGLLNQEYESDYSINGAMIQYSIKESYPEDSVYIYDIKANYNSINYIIEYTCFTEYIKPFLDKFFK